MRASIIIPTNGRAASVAQLLDSLFSALKDEPSDTWEVIVVGNMPDRRTELALLPWMRERNNVRYFCTRKIGVNIARNAGIQRAKGEIVILLDDDCRIVDSNFLERHCAWHQQLPDIAAVGGPYRSPVEGNCWTKAYSRIGRAWLEGARLELPYTSQLIGGNTSYKRSLFSEFQFDPSIRFGGSETELNMRVTQAGWALVFDPELCVRHDNALSAKNFLKRAWAQGASRKRLDLERLGPPTNFLWDQRNWEQKSDALANCGFSPHGTLEILAIHLYEIVFRGAGVWTQAKMMEEKLMPRLKICWRALARKLRAIVSGRELVRTWAVTYRAYRLRYRKTPGVES